MTLSVNQKRSIKIASIVAGVSISAIYLFGCERFQTIPSESLGVVRTFGIVQPRPLQPGLHYVAPWSKTEIVTMEFDNLEFDQDSTDSKSDPNLWIITCATKDGITIDVPVNVPWAINPETLTIVKARQPGLYYDREIPIIRSAVRDAISQFSVTDGSLFNRDAVQKAVSERIQSQTIAYYQAQGYDNPDEIIRYGLITLRGLFPPDDLVAANQKVITSILEARAMAAKTQIPTGRTVDQYTKVIQAQAIAKATEEGKAKITVITGNAPTATVVGTNP